MKAKLYKAPEETPQNSRTKIFLAGSIEMGQAKDWQSEIFETIKDFPIDVYNPRREVWDNSWKQDISNPQFYEQVTWELNHIDDADIVVMYFDPTTKSPISLMELGLLCKSIFSKSLFICCPDGFWRKGNVQIVCERYGIKLFDTLAEMTEKLVKYLVDIPVENRSN